MEEVTVLGKITLRIGSSVVGMDYVSWDGRCWLVPAWLVSPDQKSRVPLRLVAPRVAPGFKATPGPEFLELFQNTPLPQSTYEQGHIPDSLKGMVEIVENPPIFAKA